MDVWKNLKNYVFNVRSQSRKFCCGTPRYDWLMQPNILRALQRHDGNLLYISYNQQGTEKLRASALSNEWATMLDPEAWLLIASMIKH